MQFSLLAAASSLSLLTLVAAAPAPQASIPPTTAPPPDRYYLQTKVINGGDKTKDGFYVTGYHTGAGMNDIVLETTTAEAAIGFLNGTYQQFDFNSSIIWSLSLGGDSNEAAWDPAFINVGQNTEGFYFNATGLQWAYSEDGFDGWLVCDWWHGLPQLFWRFNYFDYPIPCSCTEVQLYPIPV